MDYKRLHNLVLKSHKDLKIDQWDLCQKIHSSAAIYYNDFPIGTYTDAIVIILMKSIFNCVS